MTSCVSKLIPGKNGVEKLCCASVRTDPRCIYMLKVSVVVVAVNCLFWLESSQAGYPTRSRMGTLSGSISA